MLFLRQLCMPTHASASSCLLNSTGGGFRNFQGIRPSISWPRRHLQDVEEESKARRTEFSFWSEVSPVGVLVDRPDESGCCLRHPADISLSGWSERNSQLPCLCRKVRQARDARTSHPRRYVGRNIDGTTTPVDQAGTAVCHGCPALEFAEGGHLCGARPPTYSFSSRCGGTQKTLGQNVCLAQMSRGRNPRPRGRRHRARNSHWLTSIPCWS